MRHARPDDLQPVGDLLDALRAVDGLAERTPGSFYRRGSGFLHFHVDGDRMLADLKVDGDWERWDASTPAQRKRLLTAARRLAADRP